MCQPSCYCSSYGQVMGESKGKRPIGNGSWTIFAKTPHEDWYLRGQQILRHWHNYTDLLEGRSLKKKLITIIKYL